MREIKLDCGDTIFLCEPPAGVLWLVGLPPLGLLPRTPEAKFHARKPPAWSEEEWERYQKNKAAYLSGKITKYRDKLERLACLLIEALQPAVGGDRVACNYSQKPQEFNLDIRNLTLDDLERVAAAVTPDFEPWRSFVESEHANFVSITAERQQIRESELIFGCPLRAGIDIALSQKRIREKNRQAEAATRKGRRPETGGSR